MSLFGWRGATSAAPCGEEQDWIGQKRSCVRFQLASFLLLPGAWKVSAFFRNPLQVMMEKTEDHPASPGCLHKDQLSGEWHGRNNLLLCNALLQLHY